MSVDAVQASPGPGRSTPAPRAASGWIRHLGMVACALSVLATGIEILAIVIGSGGALAGATILAWIAIGLFAVAFVLGLVATLTRNDRRFGIASAILSLVLNPITLVGLFSLLGTN